jgi:hypothetical protein
LLRKLEAKGIDKFIAHELPLDLVKHRYGHHFTVVEHDLRENDDLRALDYSGGRAFRLCSFDEFGRAAAYEKGRPQTRRRVTSAPRRTHSSRVAQRRLHGEMGYTSSPP